MELEKENEMVEDGLLDLLEAAMEVVEENLVAMDVADEPAPSLHPFFRPRQPINSAINRTNEESSPIPPTPAVLHDRAQQYLDAPPAEPDSSLVLSTRQLPRAGPYGKRPRSDDRNLTPKKVARGSDSKSVKTTVKDRLDDPLFADEPFRDLDGSLLPHLFNFSRSLSNVIFLGVLFCDACSEPLDLKKSTILNHTESKKHLAGLKANSDTAAKQSALVKYVEVFRSLFLFILLLYKNYLTIK